MLTLLSDQRRRHVVDCLANHEEPIALEELATAVATAEAETASDEQTTEIVDEIAAKLHHQHLPKLADADIIAYDIESKTVSASRASPLISLLETTRKTIG